MKKQIKLKVPKLGVSTSETTCTWFINDYFFSRIVTNITIFNYLVPGVRSKRKFVRGETLRSATLHIKFEIPLEFT